MTALCFVLIGRYIADVNKLVFESDLASFFCENSKMITKVALFGVFLLVDKGWRNDKTRPDMTNIPFTPVQTFISNILKRKTAQSSKQTFIENKSGIQYMTHTRHHHTEYMISSLAL